MIQLIYKVNEKCYNTLLAAMMHSGHGDFIYLFVGSTSEMPFSGRSYKKASYQWVKDTLFLFGYHWKQEKGKEYAI